MKDNSVLDILKSAMLLEMRGHAFYSQVAKTVTNKEVQDFFKHMANEETMHTELLGRQYKSYQEKGHFQKDNHKDANSVVDHVLSEAAKKDIGSASFEAAAIASAIDFEKRAVDLYGNRAKVATDPVEKDLYMWLSRWEQTHLDDLVKLDQELREKVWNDNSFWPM